MPAKPALDDLEAVRTVVQALEGFEAKDQERVLRWAREKLGLSTSSTPMTAPLTANKEHPTANQSSHQPSAGHSDIKTFLASKNPKSDRQFAAAVAYYFKFEAPELERKPSVTSEDLQEACRKAGRQRLTKPGQTLINAHSQGYLDKTGERGAYALNTVGENLVAMTLPEGGSNRAKS